ncbi:PDZ and LIM domain protein 2 [Anolis carolinensis]|uniref:PDZ and LIM domain protein 2 n=1 Tax=Anolis carolinensis TaxID=28377 RepID=A0A803TGD7_ANOCA|nr:PREDICTED: PDZ and LIM domain protein 2 [Anolis carolinensis]|eukprot:XP_008118366.1 PREDICTED: PDZ and LIM domain protein 2 [Anolis carolinensis]
MSVNVTLSGPPPWGFRITGGRDFRKPITVSKVTECGKAAQGDLRPGDVIVSINGESTSEMLNVEAQNKIKQSSGRLQLLIDRTPQFSLSQTNGESSPEMLSIQFQGALRTRDDGQNSVRSSFSSPASISPRPSSPFSPPSPGGRSGSPYSPRRTSLSGEGREDPVANNRSFQSLVSPARVSEERSPPLQGQQYSSSRQERRSFTPPSGPPLPSLPPLNGSPSSGSYTLCNPWEIRKEQNRSPSSPFHRSYSLDSEAAMHRLEGDSEVYKMMQENRETRAPPRQSSTFRMLQVALELDEKDGTATHFPSQLSPNNAHKPVNSSATGSSPKMHTCEKCGGGITNQAVRIQENRYRHPSCYTCTDCGLNLKMRGHFWVGEEMFCEKHARQRYQGPAGGSIATAVYSQS